MTKKGTDISNWQPEALEAFERLKQCFVAAPVLVQADHTKPFVVEVDASEYGVGAVLSQGSVALTNLRPCAFFSRKFSSAERNYDVGNRELLAIKWAFEEWRHFLEGAQHQVTVLTDHKNLTFLENAKRLNPRQARWALFFTRFNFVVTYRPGSKNVKADALSRSFCASHSPRDDPVSILPKETVVSAISPDLATEIKTHQDLRPADCPTSKVFVPTQFRLRLLKELHDSVLAGHPGVAGTKRLICRNYWWPSLARDVGAYVTACDICARAKVPRTRPPGELCPLPIPDRPWTHISMDFMTDLPTSEGKTVIWVVVDRFSKMCHLIPLRALPSSKKLAELFIRHIVKLHGLPENIVSDRGVQFVSCFWRALCKSLGITLSFSSAFHPETNGQTERVNQTVTQKLRCFVSDQQGDWVKYLPLVEFAINNQDSSSSGVSPFFCNYGFHPRHASLSGSTSEHSGVDVIVNDLCTVWAQVQKNLANAQNIQKEKGDRRRLCAAGFNVGDKVWLCTRNLHLKVPSSKLAPRFVGPYVILEAINPVAY